MKNYLNFYLILHEELQPFELARNARRPIRNFLKILWKKQSYIGRVQTLFKTSSK